VVRLSVCLSVCLSVTLVHPAKAAGRNEMSFSTDTCVAPSDVVLDGSPGLHTGKEDLGVETLIAAVSQSPRTVKHLSTVR